MNLTFSFSVISALFPVQTLFLCCYPSPCRFWSDLVLGSASGESSGNDDAMSSVSADTALTQPSMEVKAKVLLEMLFKEGVALPHTLWFLRTPLIFLHENWSLPNCSMGSGDWPHCNNAANRVQLCLILLLVYGCWMLLKRTPCANPQINAV